MCQLQLPAQIISKMEYTFISLVVTLFLGFIASRLSCQILGASLIPINCLIEELWQIVFVRDLHGIPDF